MANFSKSDDLHRARFNDVDLLGSRFTGCDLSGAVMRGVDVQGAEIDTPWLLEDGGVLLVNGVDVAPLIRAELEHRFPGRAGMRARDPEGLRRAWASLERTWAEILKRAAGMPPGTVDASVDGEWSFAQSLRHLVMATDVWLRQAILGLEYPYHPFGQPNADYAADGYDMSVFSTTAPSYAEVLEARAGRVAMVRQFLASLTPGGLAVMRENPWMPGRPESTLSCLQTILPEEWEHLRFAVRDLDSLERPDPR